MNEILHHPATGNFLACLLIVWPLMRIYQRVGLSPWWGLAIFANLALPWLGFTLTAALLGFQSWPKLPKPTPKARPQKKDWGKEG